MNKMKMKIIIIKIKIYFMNGEYLLYFYYNYF